MLNKFLVFAHAFNFAASIWLVARQQVLAIGKYNGSPLNLLLSVTSCT